MLDDGLKGAVCLGLIEYGDNFLRTAKGFYWGSALSHRFELDIFFVAQIDLDGIDAIALGVKKKANDGMGEIFVCNIGDNAFITHVGAILDANVCADGKWGNGLEKNFNHARVEVRTG